MFGSAFMVAPITTSADRRSVYLPEATKWTNFWTGRAVTGGQHLNVEAPLQQIPLFIRAGAILPLGPAMEYATQKPDDPIEIRVYPGANGSFVLYEDENDNYDYEKGAYATIPVYVERCFADIDDWARVRASFRVCAKRGRSWLLL